ncbi:thioester domain-containing protein [Mycetocola zhujimingii]|uniref:thioester domain-containing protein n=1 Tax=Mycetocola zhujimingii TaxID=2079792 RepID=UPI000D382821|nr:thioester domain-containing protein [Mycetocola zhujimingii]AWB87759.1 hypothetical protein C3E77_14895 [Mycetocola zhujimingii]
MNATPASRFRVQLEAHRVLLSFLAVVAVFAMVLTPLGGAARASVPDPFPISDAEPGANTEIRATALGAAQRVAAFAPPTSSPPDPAEPYPTANPTGYQAVGRYAGTIITSSVDNPALTAEVYCIELGVETQVGVGYESATWDEANVANIGYVAYIVNNYYPSTTEPSGLTDNQRAAAVQAAIWWFTDGYIVNTSEQVVRAATVAIVEAAQAAGPATQPPAPDVSITPPAGEAPVGSAAGPFVVAAEGAAELTVSVPTGYSMFADAAATTPLANPSTVASGTSIWVTSETTTPNETTLSARAAVTAQGGQIYVYDGNDPNLPDAQSVILARTTELEAVAQATPGFFAAGSLTVTKTFAGDGVGQQGPIQLLVDCGEGFSFTSDIAATATEPQTFTYPGIPIGNTCTVTEPTTGSTTAVDVTTDAPQSATIDEDGETVTIANTVTLRPGGLTVTKVVTGAAAGLQGDIVLDIDCGTALAETFTLPAGTVAGSYVQSFTDLPSDTECTITETSSGSTDTVLVEPSDDVTVTIQPGGVADATITNTATLRPGDLTVTKIVTGEAAGLQDEIVLEVNCGEALTEVFTVPARADAGSYVATYTEIPAGTECTITETSTGATESVLVESTEDVTVGILPGFDVNATITNTVTEEETPETPVTPSNGGGHSDYLPMTGTDSPLLLAGGVIAAGALLVLLAGAKPRRREVAPARLTS